MIKALRAISEAHNFTPEIMTAVIPDNGFLEADRRFRELFRDLEEKGYTIDLDITSGRKALATAAVVQAGSSGLGG